MPDNKISIICYPFIGLIKLYRLTLSPYIGNQCRFYPTCSHYSEEALKTHGLARGIILAAKRLFKCHPWHEGGLDPVPEKNLSA